MKNAKNFPSLAIALILGLTLSAGLFAAEVIKPIVLVADLTPKQDIWETRAVDKPHVVKSAKEAAAFFNEENVAKLEKSVDFTKQVVLVFAWRGSGQDKLTFDVAESSPEQVTFRYMGGRTRDLRPHFFVYALRSDVKWEVAKGR